MNLKARRVKSVLMQKGFREESNSHHKYLVLYDQVGKATNVKTRMSFNDQDIDIYLFKNMAKQVKLSKDDFGKLIDCSLSYVTYLELLVSKNLI